MPSANNGPKFNELHLKFPSPLHCDIFQFFNRIRKYIRKYLLKIPEIHLKTWMWLKKILVPLCKAYINPSSFHRKKASRYSQGNRNRYNLIYRPSGNCNFCEINKALKDFFDQFTKSFNEFVVQNNGVWCLIRDLFSKHIPYHTRHHNPLLIWNRSWL